MIEIKKESEHDMKRVYIWGTGRIAEYIYHYYKDNQEINLIVGCIDNDSSKEGSFFHDVPILKPSVLEEDRDCYIIILAAAYKEIERQIIEDYPWMAGRLESPLLFTKYRLLSRYQKSSNPEIIKVMDYLTDHPLQVFNYTFTSQYQNDDYEVSYDSEKGLFYALFENKKMYFSRFYRQKKEIQDYCRQIMMEQDRDSPHKYLTEQFGVNENSIVVDAGAAEGNFALSIIDKVKKIYLFEPDFHWAEALKYTFEPYADKVTIVNKYLSDYTDNHTVMLDTYLMGQQVDFIKLDIEGEEYHALQGAKEIISASNKMKCVVCTYHQEYDYIVLNQLFKELGYKTEPSKGYMWFPYDKNIVYSLPSLRRGLIRAKKEK